MLRRHASSLLSGCVILALVLAWQFICQYGQVPKWLIPSPAAILQAIWDNRVQLVGHVEATLLSTLGGFALALLLGVPLAVAITSSRIARNVLYPIFLVFQSVPKIALAPLILLWVGYGLSSKVAVSAVTAFFPIVVNMAAGINAIGEEMLQLTRAYNPTGWRVFWKVKLPFAMPYLFSGMTVAMTLAVIGAVVGEFVGADSGLGFIILTASSTMNTPLVFSAMLLLSVMGILLFFAIALVERLLCPWYRPPERERL